MAKPKSIGRTMRVAHQLKLADKGEFAMALELIDVHTPKNQELSLLARRCLLLMLEAAAGDAWKAEPHRITSLCAAFARGDHLTSGPRRNALAAKRARERVSTRREPQAQGPNLMQTLYTAVATATGGRQGHVRSDDGVLDHETSVPKAMGGPGGAATNPEQLFAAGYAACFQSAMLFVAAQQKLHPGETHVTGHVAIGPKEGGGFMLAVRHVVDAPDMEQAAAEKLVHDAHAVCPYSNATRGNIAVEFHVRGKAA